MGEVTNKNKSAEAPEVKAPELDAKALEAKIRKELDAEYNQKLAKLQEELTAAKKAEPTTEVEGHVSLKVETPEGKTKTVKVGISDGHPNIRPLPGQAFIMKSEQFLKFAAGKYSEKESKPLIEAGLTVEGAKDRLREMLENESNMIKIL